MPSLTIHLSEEHARFIQELVDAGEHKDRNEVIREALQLLMEKHEGLQKLREMLEEAAASGYSKTTLEEIWAEARAKFTDGSTRS